MRCEKCATATVSKIKFELRSHVGLNHYNKQLVSEVKKMFVDLKYVDCDKELKRADQQQIHLLYNHTKWVELISAETEKVIKKAEKVSSQKKRKLQLPGSEIRLIPTSKLMSREVKRKLNPDSDKEEELPDVNQIDKRKQIKSENIEMIKNGNLVLEIDPSTMTKKIDILKLEATSKVLSKVDSLLEQYKETTPQAKEDVTPFEKQIEKKIEDDDDFEEIVQDEEMLEEDLEAGDEDSASGVEVENVAENIKKIQEELIKMQEISDDEEEDEEEDRMQDFEDEDNLDDVLNFKEDGDRNEASEDIGNCDENDIDWEISIMGDDDVVDISELEEVVC